MANPRGQPRKSPDRVRSQVLQLRLTVGERKAYEQAAKRADLSVSEWIRASLAQITRRSAKGG
jgi:hypothetical protein